MKKERSVKIEDLVDPEATPLLKSPIVTSMEQEDIVFGQLITGKMADEKIRSALVNLPDKKEVLKARLKMTDREVSDEQLFEDIAENPLLLGSRYAQEKIHRWRQELKSDDSLVSFRAQEKLKRIGDTLALKGRPQGISKALVAAMREGIYRQLKDRKILSWKSEGNIRLALKKLFGKEIVDAMCILPSTYSELVNEITARIMGLTSATVERHCKDTEKLAFKSATAFVEKPARKPSKKK